MKRISVIFAFFLSAISYGQKTIITGHIKNTTANSIKCTLLPNNVFEKMVAITIPLAEGKFIVILPIKKTTFLSFEDGSNYYGGFIQPGDSIVITYDAVNLKNTLLFSGKGKEKFLLSDSINQLRAAFNDEKEKIKNQPFPVDYLFNKIDSFQNKLIQRLIYFKSLMSTESFKLLNAYIKTIVLRTKYNGAVSIFGDAYDNILKKQQSRLTTPSKKAVESLLKFDNNLSYSYFYISNVVSLLSAYFDDNIKPQTGSDLHAKYHYLTKKLPSNLKSPALFLLIEREIRQNKQADIEAIIEQSFPFSKDSTYKKFVSQKLADARISKNGITAPDFSLENVNGEKIHLSSFKGKVIYMDFWFAAS